MNAEVNGLARAEEVYSCSSAKEIINHRVAWQELGNFSRALKALEKDLADEAYEEYWSSVIRPFRRYIFLMSSTPLAADHPAVYAPGTIERLENHLRRAHLSYPSFSGKASDILTSFSAIVGGGGSRLFEELEKLFEDRARQTSAIVLKDTKFAVEVALTLKNGHLLKEVEVVGTHHLRSDRCYDNLIVLGAPSWYPEYLLGAARARKVHVITYSWMRSAWKAEAAFYDSPSSEHIQDESAAQSPNINSEERVDTGYFISPEDLLPKIDLDAISERFARKYESGPEYELVDASLLTLEGAAVVFIAASDKAKVLTIDPETDSSVGNRERTSRLRRFPVSYLELGTYILLRTSGGGDYIIPLADKLLGPNAEYITDCQSHWKGLLREEVAQKGLFQVSYDLLELGSIRAEESNVRNWVSTQNIRPEDERDFVAILKLIGLEDKTSEYWRNARALGNARLRAGAMIRKMLLKEVAIADLDELERTGRMGFELPGEDAGSFTAFRVLAVSEKKYKVPISSLEAPFESEDDIWPE
jgi:hypothetical protein